MSEKDQTQQDIMQVTPEISGKIQDFAEKVRFGEPNWVALCDRVNFREAQTYLRERQQETSSVPSAENDSLLRVAESDFSLVKLEMRRNDRDVRGYRQATDTVGDFEMDIVSSYQNKFPGRKPSDYFSITLDAMKQIQNSIFSPDVGQVQADES